MSTAGREYTLGIAGAAAGAALVLLSVRQGWARVAAPAPPPLPAGVVPVSGQALVPLAGALGVAALAGLAAVIAGRGLARRLAGLLVAAFGTVIAVTVSRPVAAATVLAAAAAAAPSPAGSATAGGPAGAAPGAVPGAAAPGITAAGHVTMTAGLWRPAAVAGALAIVAAGVLVCWRGTRWPVMSGRYQRPGQAGRGPATDGPATDGPATDGAALWDALSGGADPTEPAGERPPPRGPG